MEQRIEFVDLAKGITILIIALTHTLGDSGCFWLISLCIFKVPVFFVLSGLFFNTYDGAKMFLSKKANQLLIPVLFAFLVLSLPWTILLDWYFEKETTIRDLFLYPLTYKINFGLAPAAWFVLCLLIVELLFYCIYRLFGKIKVALPIFIFLCGAVGYIVGARNLNLPIWVDTAFTCMPYFLLGVYLGKKNYILRESFAARHWLILLASILLLALFVSMIGNGDIFYAGNQYSVSPLCLFGGAFSGSVLILLVSKRIDKLPVVSYIGRYSLIMLLTHQFYLFLIRNLIHQFCMPQDNLWLNLFVFVLLIVITIPTIKFCKSFLPWFFGLKNVI